MASAGCALRMLRSPVCCDCLDEYEAAAAVQSAVLDSQAVMNAAAAQGGDRQLADYISAVTARDDGATMQLLGRQAAYVMKHLDPMDEINNEEARQVMRTEYERLDSIMGEVVELESLPEDAYVVRAKLLLDIKHWEAVHARKYKARMVVQGNVIFDKLMRIMRAADLADFWAPVASLTGARVVEARAAAHRRQTTGIDLTAAYTQIPMGGTRHYYIILPQIAYQVMNEEQAKRYSGFKQPVRRTLGGWHGIQRAGTDFV